MWGILKKAEKVVFNALRLTSGLDSICRRESIDLYTFVLE